MRIWSCLRIVSSPPDRRTSLGSHLEQLELADWRRRVADLYVAVRASPDPEEAWELWRRARRELFTTHPQTPLEPDAKEPPEYFDYDPSWRMEAVVRETEPAEISLPASSGTSVKASRFARVHFRRQEIDMTLPLFWLSGYAGGLFLAFRDATSGRETYGGGRYLLDSAKSADLGGPGDHLILDFNFAYQPSCSYSARWSCPLPAEGATLPMSVEAGERLRH